MGPCRRRYDSRARWGIVVVVAAAAALSPSGVARAADWGPIVQCESGGRNVENPGPSTASGYFQFVDGTWRRYGGQQFGRRAIDATYEEQRLVAERAYSNEGYNPWKASEECWGPKMDDEIPEPRIREAPEPRPDREPPHRPDRRPPPERDHYVVKRGDTLSDIAEDHGTTWPRLFQRNRDVIDDPDLIYPGEQLAV
jgi:resuscitation-promoting factor RpfA